LGYIRGRKREEKIKGTKEESPSMVRFILILRKERKTLKLWAMDRGKEHCLPMRIGIGGGNWS
jgi:hypothetical protein